MLRCKQCRVHIPLGTCITKHVCKPAWVVWQEGEKEEEEGIVIYNDSASEAAEEYTEEHHDPDEDDKVGHGDATIDLCVKSMATGKVEKVVVSGEVQCVYYVHDRV